jgi:hypothetical protein
VSWNKIFSNATQYETIPFSEPHWNSYLDLTGDCRADVVITNNNNQVEYWINHNNVFELSGKPVSYGDFNSLSFSDISNYAFIQTMMA